MALRRRLCALLLASLTGLAGVSYAADTPPTKLHLVGDHWTAWNPPTDHSPEAKIHIVQRGDTLWALAGQHLGNPYLWPQIWEKNQYVLDAHWIYPGDPLVIGIEVAPAETLGDLAPAAEAAPEIAADEPAAADRMSATDRRRNTPVPLGGETDIYCSGYIGEAEETFSWSVIGSEYDGVTPRLNAVQDWAVAKGIFGRTDTLKYELTQGDIVYLDGGSQSGLSPGMLLTTIEPRNRVRHPTSGDFVGRFYAYTGRVRVLTAREDRAIAEVVHACVGVHVGSQLVEFEEEPIPLVRWPISRPANDPTTNDLGEAPVILHAESSLFTLGQDHLVFIDLGQGDVYPGDVFTIYRPSLKGQYPVPVGELGVLTVRGNSAVAKILESRYPVYIGDRLERR